MSHAYNPILDDLRERISKIESGKAKKAGCLSFGVPEIDERLPGGGLAYGAIHEVAGGGAGTVEGAAPALFVAGIAARTKGNVIWCLNRPDLFFPALAQVGLHPDRVIFVEADKEEDILASMEEALAFGGLGAVVGEVVRLPMTASRRLHLAAEKTGSLGLVIRRWRRQTEAGDFGNPTASTTRWRISVLPSEPLPVEGIGRHRWLAELMRVKAGECAEWEISAFDGDKRIGISRDSQSPAALSLRGR